MLEKRIKKEHDSGHVDQCGPISRQIEGFLRVFVLLVSKMEMDGGFGLKQFVLWRGAKRIVVGEEDLQTSKISSVFKVSQLI